MRYKLALIDVLVITASYFVALGVRLLNPGVVGTRRYVAVLATVMPVILAVHLGINALLGAYERGGRHAGSTETARAVQASLIAIPVLVALVVAGRRFNVVVPLATVLLGGLASLIGMASVRFIRRRV